MVWNRQTNGYRDMAAWHQDNDPCVEGASAAEGDCLESAQLAAQLLQEGNRDYVQDVIAKLLDDEECAQVNILPRAPRLTI